MAKKGRAKAQVSWTSGDISGSQITLGDNNVVVRGSSNQVSQAKSSGISQAEYQMLLAEFSKLKQQIELKVSPEKKAEALEKAGELRSAVMGKKPDPSQMASVREWFVRNAPGIAGAVTSLVVNPIVDKLVEAAGDAIAGQFRRHFGVAS